VTALVVAAHGYGDGSETNRLVLQQAHQAAQFGGFREWGVAFHNGTPHFSQALANIAAQEVVVVPFMTSDGYYSRVVLPRELKPDGRRLRITPAVGTSPSLVPLILQRLRDLSCHHQIPIEEMSVLIVGHGTPRHPQSRQSSQALAAQLQRWFDVQVGFLDEDPGPQEALAQLVKPYRVVVPFLIGPGDHAIRDLPARLGQQERLWIDRPLGFDPALAQLIAHSARNGEPSWSHS